MLWIDTERARMNAGGTTYREQYENEIIGMMNDTFNMASDYMVIQAESATPNVTTDIETRVVGKVKNANFKVDTMRKIIFRDPHYPVNLGDVFFFEGKSWIATSTYTNTIPKSCIVEWFNNTARFYDENGTLYEIPCNIKNRLRDLERDGYLRIPDNRMQITLKYDPVISSKIRYAPKWTRMLFNGQAYHVEAIDTVSDVQADGKGFMTILLASDLIGAYDDVVNNIADRFLPRNISVQINNGSQLEMRSGSTLQLNITVENDGETIINPSLTFISSDSNIATVDETGLVTAITDGNVTITVGYNGIADFTSIKVVTAIKDLYSIVISGNDQIYEGREQTYIGHVMNNGVEVFDKSIDWTLTADGGGSTILATIVPNGNSVKVVANNNGMYGYVRLWGTLPDQPTVFSEKRIRIKSII